MSKTISKIKTGIGKVVISNILFTVAAQGAIYGLANHVNVLAIVVVVFLFILSNLITYILTDRESFQLGLMASKDNGRIQAAVASQVKQTVSLIDKERQHSAKETATPTPASIKPNFENLEITGL